MGKTYWTASNNNSFLNGYREANTELSAVRAARNYLQNELYGDGEISYFDENPEENNVPPFRIDEKTMFTGHKWEKQVLGY